MADLIREIVIDATPETIWPFLTEAGKHVEWIGTLAGVAPKAMVPLSIDAGAPPVDKIAAAPRLSVPPPRSRLPPRIRRALAALVPLKLAAPVTS